MYSSTCDINVEQSCRVFRTCVVPYQMCACEGSGYPNPPSPFRIIIPTLSYVCTKPVQEVLQRLKYDTDPSVFHNDKNHAVNSNVVTKQIITTYRKWLCIVHGVHWCVDRVACSCSCSAWFWSVWSDCFKVC